MSLWDFGASSIEDTIQEMKREMVREERRQLNLRVVFRDVGDDNDKTISDIKEFNGKHSALSISKPGHEGYEWFEIPWYEEFEDLEDFALDDMFEEGDSKEEEEEADSELTSLCKRVTKAGDYDIKKARKVESIVTHFALKLKNFAMIKPTSKKKKGGAPDKGISFANMFKKKEEKPVDEATEKEMLKKEGIELEDQIKQKLQLLVLEIREVIKSKEHAEEMYSKSKEDVIHLEQMRIQQDKAKKMMEKAYKKFSLGASGVLDTSKETDNEISLEMQLYDEEKGEYESVAYKWKNVRDAKVSKEQELKEVLTKVVTMIRKSTSLSRKAIDVTALVGKVRVNKKKIDGNPSSKYNIHVNIVTYISEFATIVIKWKLGTTAKFLPSVDNKALYFEVRVHAENISKLGWANLSHFKPSNAKGKGAGGDEHSFSYDVSRGKKFHKGEETLYGKKWKQHDNEENNSGFVIVGCKYHSCKGIISYSVNGDDMGTAFAVKPQEYLENTNLFLSPVITCTTNEVIEIMTHEKDLKYLPSDSISIDKLLMPKISTPPRLRRQSSSNRSVPAGVIIPHEKCFKKLTGRVQLAFDLDENNEVLSKVTTSAFLSKFATIVIRYNRQFTTLPDSDQNKGLYYEIWVVGVAKGKVSQVGWADLRKFRPNEKVGGAGDDEYSWSFDGSQNLKCNDGKKSNYGWIPSEVAWRPGVVIGCKYHPSDGTISFSLNGKDLGTAFQLQSDKNTLLSPVISCEEKEVIEIRTHDDDLKHMPADCISIYKLMMPAPTNSNQLQSTKKEKKNKIRTKRKKVMGTKVTLDANAKLPDAVPKSSKERDFLQSVLKDIFLFSALSAKEMKLLIDVMQKEVAKAGSIVIKQGDVGDFFYVIEQGTIDIIIDGTKHVGSFASGRSFGELALLYDAPRSATCKARDECVLWKVDQASFRYLLAKNAQSEDQKNIEILSCIPLFSNLPKPMIIKFSNAMSKKKFKTGDRIVKKGDIGETFYLIEEGKVKVHDIGNLAEDISHIIGPSECFGERALLTGEPRSANCTALTDVVTFEMKRKTFEESIGSLESVLQQQMKQNTIESLPIFANSDITPAEMAKLVKKISDKKIDKGVKIAEAGKPFKQQIVVILKGKFSVASSSGMIITLRTSDQYGESTIKLDSVQKCEETVIVDENAEVHILTRDDIISVIGDMNRLGNKGTLIPQIVDKSVDLQDLTKHRVLGQGAYGLVWLTSMKDSNEAFALKMMTKRDIITAGMVESINREKVILASLDHPFILTFIASMQDDESLYLLTKMYPGGELFNLIHDDDDFNLMGLPDDDVVFYGACISDALGYFHERLICYRDLKPENVMIDSQGYCVLVDLGFAKVVTTKTYTLCGTPEYLAPEIITGKGHNKACDWWSFGVLVYEMIMKETPFYSPGKGQVELFESIVKIEYDIQSYVNDVTTDLLERLITKKKSKRLGNLARGYLDVQDHPFFDEINFDDLRNRKIEAPWVPLVNDPFDSQHFKAHIEEEKVELKKLSIKEQEQFSGF